MNIIKNALEKEVKLDTFKATMICEGDFTMAGVDNPTEELVIQAWQYLIDTGLAWTLQGWFGRTAQQLIKAGICHKPS